MQTLLQNKLLEANLSIFGNWEISCIYIIASIRESQLLNPKNKAGAASFSETNVSSSFFPQGHLNF